MSISNGNQPAFDVDARYGEAAESQFARLFDGSNGLFEVKRKRLQDASFYVETECLRDGRYVPSGINVTKARYWVYLIGESDIFVIFPTELLRVAMTSKAARDVAETDGSHPTRGKLVKLTTALGYRRSKKEPLKAPPLVTPMFGQNRLL